MPSSSSSCRLNSPRLPSIGLDSSTKRARITRALRAPRRRASARSGQHNAGFPQACENPHDSGAKIRDTELRFFQRIDFTCAPGAMYAGGSGAGRPCAAKASRACLPALCAARGKRQLTAAQPSLSGNLQGVEIEVQPQNVDSRLTQHAKLARLDVALHESHHGFLRKTPGRRHARRLVKGRRR